MSKTPLVEMKNIHKRFGGVHAVEDVSVDLYPGEVVGVLGHNGAGKSCLMRMLAGAMPIDEGEVYVNGEKADIDNPRDARRFGIETIYQTLALADNLDAPSNLFLGRELLTKLGTLDDDRMEAEARKVFKRLNPNFTNVTDPVRSMSGGQRQVVAIGRAIYFDAKILIMDEPTAALGPSETAMVADLTKQLKSEGIGIFLISHDMHDVFDLCDRVMVMKNGQNVGSFKIDEVTKDDILSLIIIGKLPDDWKPRNQ
ncbi:MAG: ATP-binding cassette domain-containing protein [Alphaproteobacteria bacterium]|nr:ATP-binding cassette domain-containing protein [Alphaproteobacteria bacterium]